jgi:hypothetical protein
MYALLLQLSHVVTYGVYYRVKDVFGSLDCEDDLVIIAAVLLLELPQVLLASL